MEGEFVDINGEENVRWQWLNDGAGWHKIEHPFKSPKN
jgi:hypothetical protein